MSRFLFGKRRCEKRLSIAYICNGGLMKVAKELRKYKNLVSTSDLADEISSALPRIIMIEAFRSKDRIYCSLRSCAHAGA